MLLDSDLGTTHQPHWYNPNSTTTSGTPSCLPAAVFSFLVESNLCYLHPRAQSQSKAGLRFATNTNRKPSPVGNSNHSKHKRSQAHTQRNTGLGPCCQPSGNSPLPRACGNWKSWAVPAVTKHKIRYKLRCYDLWQELNWANIVCKGCEAT